MINDPISKKRAIDILKKEIFCAGRDLHELCLLQDIKKQIEKIPVESISETDGRNGPKILHCQYSEEVNEYDYSELTCVFEDGTKRIFYYHIANPMPCEKYIKGLTWDELVAMAKGMFYMAADECRYQPKKKMFKNIVRKN